MAARIYADVPGNKCQCGGVYSKRVPHPDDHNVIVPKCASCDAYPSLFLIDADARDLNGGKIRVKIRHTQNSDRLDKMSKVLFTLERIAQEINEGSFDIRKYDSAISKEAFIFKNYAKEYEAHHERRLVRGDITPKGLLDKKGLIKRELLPFFGNHELSRINLSLINKFRDSYVSKFRTRDLALGELKALLNQAVKDGLLQVAPKFDPIPRSKIRGDVIPMDVARETVARITNEKYRDMYSILLIYPLRPSELRALKWKNLDFENNTINITHHFSDETLIKGRKSIKEGEKSQLTYPLSIEARSIFNKYRAQKVMALNWKESFVFTGYQGRHISGEAFSEAWRKARKGLHTFDAYECRHATTSELYSKLNGDLIKLKKVSGHTNVTTLERYVRDRSDLSELF